MTFENLSVKRVIVHETLAGGDVSRRPHQSQDITPLDVEIKDALQRRMVEALGDDSFSIQAEIEQDGDSSVFQIAVSLIGCNQRQFVAGSKEIAQLLSNSQTHGQIRAGLAVIIEGSVGTENHPFVAIIKAETDTGFVTSNSGPVVRLQYIKDLFLTPHQKLYKIAAFVQTNRTNSGATRQKDDFEAYVYDHLMTRGEGHTAAAYFLRTFMGCSIAPTAKRMTLRFYEYTTEFINNLNIDDESKIDAKNNLNAYLRNNSQTLRGREFASDYFDEEAKTSFLVFLKEKDFPTTSVPKDIGLIKNKLKTRRIKFSEGIRLTGPAEGFSERVKIGGDPLGSGWTLLQVRGSIEEQA